MKLWYLLFAIAVLLLLITACGEATPAAAPQPTPPSTAEPVATSGPTAAPAESPVNEAELTPVPVPSAVQGASSTSLGVSPGSSAPDFELGLLGKDGTLRLSDFKGKVVVLNFWASWCPPCRWEMPDFERMWQEYRDKDVVFLGVAVADFEDKALGFAEKTGVTYPLGLDATGEVAKDYGITSMPTTYFIDREGKVARRLVSVANKGVLRVFLEGQLKQ